MKTKKKLNNLSIQDHVATNLVLSRINNSTASWTRNHVVEGKGTKGLGHSKASI